MEELFLEESAGREGTSDEDAVVGVVAVVDRMSVEGCGSSVGETGNAEETEVDVDPTNSCSTLSIYSRRASTDCTSASKSAGRSDNPACIFSMSAMASLPAAKEAAAGAAAAVTAVVSDEVSTAVMVTGTA